MLLAIWILKKSVEQRLMSTKYHRWTQPFRESLFPTLCYFDVGEFATSFQIPKISDPLVMLIAAKCKSASKSKRLIDAVSSGSHELYYFRAVLYWFKVLTKPPTMEEDGETATTSEMKLLRFSNAEDRDVAWCCMASNLFSLFYVTYSSCQVVNSPDLEFPIDIKGFSSQQKRRFSQLSKHALVDINANSLIQTRDYSSRGRCYTMKKQYFYFKRSKHLIDQIDTALAEHYGFTPEELDFIINYDIKYRMGLGGGSAEEEDEE